MSIILMISLRFTPICQRLKSDLLEIQLCQLGMNIARVQTLNIFFTSCVFVHRKLPHICILLAFTSFLSPSLSVCHDALLFDLAWSCLVRKNETGPSPPRNGGQAQRAGELRVRHARQDRGIAQALRGGGRGGNIRQPTDGCGGLVRRARQQ